MTTVSIEEAQAHLAELIEKLPPGEALTITRENTPIARLVGVPAPGAGAGTLIILSDDDDYLEDWKDYLP